MGSTGSIGTQTLEVVARHADRFRVLGLAANSRFDLLAEQIRKFKPRMVCLGREGNKEIQALARRLGMALIQGPEGLIRLAGMAGADMVVNSLVGAAGLEPTLAAIAAGHDIALANKETLVAGGDLVMKTARSRGVRILPIDSEHAALHQCLDGRDPKGIQRLILTASGGPFRGLDRRGLRRVRAEHALRHPTWSMGPKITVDSATLMNKGLEVLEAHHLFGLPLERIEVVIHPQSIVHSLVEFVDGSLLAQLSVPDMRLPIQYALCYPQRLPSLVKSLDLSQLGQLSFHRPDTATFRCLELAYLAGRMGGVMPAVMNAANEVAVEAFLAGRIGFLRIPQVILGAMESLKSCHRATLRSITKYDALAREEARRLCGLKN